MFIAQGRILPNKNQMDEVEYFLFGSHNLHKTKLDGIAHLPKGKLFLFCFSLTTVLILLLGHEAEKKTASYNQHMQNRFEPDIDENSRSRKISWELATRILARSREILFYFSSPSRNSRFDRANSRSRLEARDIEGSNLDLVSKHEI